MEKTELDYRLELIALVSFCSTCKTENPDFWMLCLRKHLNDVNKFLGDKDRFEYDGYGLILKKEEGNKPINEKEKRNE